MPTLPTGATGYTVQRTVAIDPDSEQIVKGAWGVLRPAAGSASTLPMFTLAGVQITGVRSGARSGIVPAFLMGVTDAVLDFGGGFALPVVGIEASRSTATLVGRLNTLDLSVSQSAQSVGTLESRLGVAESALAGVQQGPAANGSIVLDTDGVPAFVPGTLDPNRPPNPPRNVTAVPVGSSSVLVAHDGPEFRGGVIDYRIRYRPSGGTWVVFAHEPSTIRTQTVTGLTVDQAYEFEVSSVGVGGTSAPAAVVTATPTLTILVDDDYNRADSPDTVGPPLVGPSGQVYNITGVTSTFGISGNKLVMPATSPAGFGAIYAYDPGAPDYRVTWTGVPFGALLIFRLAAFNDFLSWDYRFGGGNVARAESNGNTFGASVGNAGPASLGVPSVECVGDVFRFYTDTTLITTLTIPGAATGGAGIRLGGGQTLDAFRITSPA